MKKYLLKIKRYLKKSIFLLKEIWKDPKKKKILIAIIIVFLISSGFAIYKVFHQAPKKIYEVAIMVRSQHNNDPNEDARTSLKVGDVLVVKPEGHKWSKTEKVSYLIIKMNLTEDQSHILAQPREREVKKSELSEKEKKTTKNTNYIRKETIIAREYRIKIEKFKDFNSKMLIKGQPYMEKVYGWDMVEKK
jgi:hypothetical protein